MFAPPFLRATVLWFYSCTSLAFRFFSVARLLYFIFYFLPFLSGVWLFLRCNHLFEGRMGNTTKVDQSRVPLWTLLWTFWGFVCCIIYAYLRKTLDFFSLLMGWSSEDPCFIGKGVSFPIPLLLATCSAALTTPWLRRGGVGVQGEAALLKDKEYFFFKFMFGRIRDCWDRPICSRPGAQFHLMERNFDNSLYGPYEYTGKTTTALNLGLSV